MLILAIDTSTTSGSIAIVASGKLIAAKNVTGVKAHAAWLMSAIVELLDSTEYSIDDIELIAVGSGPGSFTGLRIAVSTVKGLAWSLGVEVCGVSTLKALAMNINKSSSKMASLICPVLDARKKELYCALYRYEGDALVEVMADSALSPVSLVSLITAREEPVVMLGSGLDAYGEYLSANIGSLEIAHNDLLHIRAENIARLATLDDAVSTAPHGLRPTYKRKSEAEVTPGVK